LLDYKSGAATAASVILGVLVLFLVATTTSTLSLVNQVPLAVHIVFDYAIAAVMIAAPFLFGFSGKSTPTAVFLAGGVLWLLLSIGTRYRKEEVPARGEPKRRGRSRGGLPPAGSGEFGGAAAAERPSRVRPSADAVPDDSIPEFEPPPRHE
jgi:hypothetical protein